MFRRLYTGLLLTLLPFLAVLFVWWLWRRPEYRDRWWQRLGFSGPRRLQPCVWIHAVSVGEVAAATPLIKRLQQHYPAWPVVVTTLTPTGADRVRRNFSDSVTHCYLPLDTPGAMGRLLDRIQPRLVVIMETELWPNLLATCGRRGIPIIIANARISPRSLKTYLRLRPLMRELLRHVGWAAAQSPADADRLTQIGLDPGRIRVMGNLKFEFHEGESRACPTDWRAGWGATRRVWVAGSTHEGEDAQLIDALLLLRERWPDLLLVLVPRHPQRFAAVRALLEARGIAYARRSAGEWPAADVPVFLADTMGELGALYGAADLAFIGGSLVPIGGHNPLEAAVHGVPVLTGPAVFNFEDIYSALCEMGAAVTVEDAESLAHGVEQWLQDPTAAQWAGKRGRQWVMDNQGALDRLWALVDPYLSDPGASLDQAVVNGAPVGKAARIQ
ncbi:MAG: lipid IV(A) 3-deoxy-D-manno-octulosonic acid transferase [Pseudomonadota bacterium]